MDSKKLTDEVQAHVGLNSENNGMTVKVFPCDDITKAITDLDSNGKRIWVSKQFALKRPFHEYLSYSSLELYYNF